MNKIHFKRIITNATENTTDPICFPETLKLTPEGKLHNKEFSDPYIIKPIKGGSSVGVKIIKDPMKESSLTLNYKELAFFFNLFVNCFDVNCSCFFHNF